MKILPPATYIGAYNCEVENLGLADRYEVEVCRRYVWKYDMTLKLVSTYIVKTRIIQTEIIQDYYGFGIVFVWIHTMCFSG